MKERCKRGNGRTSGPVFTSQFMVVPDHSAFSCQKSVFQGPQCAENRVMSNLTAMALAIVLRKGKADATPAGEEGLRCNNEGGGGVGSG